MVTRKPNSKRPVRAEKSAFGQIRDQMVELKRQEILRVAGQLFSSKGFTQTSMDDIAAELAIGKPQIYVHFPTKTALLAEICNRTTSLAASLALEAAGTDGAPAERLARMVRELTTRIIEGRLHLAVLFRELKHLPGNAVDELAKNYHLFNHSFTDLLEQGVKAGEFKVSNAAVVTHAISGMTTWVYSWYRADGPLSADQVADQMVDISMKMVSASKSSLAEASTKAGARKRSAGLPAGTAHQRREPTA